MLGFGEVPRVDHLRWRHNPPFVSLLLLLLLLLHFMHWTNQTSGQFSLIRTITKICLFYDAFIYFVNWFLFELFRIELCLDGGGWWWWWCPVVLPCPALPCPLSSSPSLFDKLADKKLSNLNYSNLWANFAIKHCKIYAFTY